MNRGVRCGEVPVRVENVRDWIVHFGGVGFGPSQAASHVQERALKHVLLRGALAPRSKDCKNEEIRDYANKFIVSNEDCKTFDQIKEKLKFRFGKTEKQKDKEVRTKFKGSQLIGNIGEYFIKSVVQELFLYGKICSCRIVQIGKLLSPWQILKL